MNQPANKTKDLNKGIKTVFGILPIQQSLFHNKTKDLNKGIKTVHEICVESQPQKSNKTKDLNKGIKTGVPLFAILLAIAQQIKPKT